MQKPNRVRPRTAREMPLKIGPIALLPDLKAEKQSANGGGSFGACQPTQRQWDRTVDRGTEKGRHDQTVVQPGGRFLCDLCGQHGAACIAAQKQ